MSERKLYIPRGGRVYRFEYHREVGDDEVTLKVEASVSRYDAGRSYGPIDRCYPAEGGTCEDFIARIGDTEVDVTDKEAAEINQRAEELAAEDDFSEDDGGWDDE